MTDAEVGEIMKRLERVERKIRQYRAVLVGVGLIAAVGVGAPPLRSAAIVPTIRAKAFVVVDDAGVGRALLGTAGDQTMLGLFDKAGKPRAGLATFGDEAVLTLSDKAGKDRVVLGAVGDAASLKFADKAGNPRAVLGAGGDGALLGLSDVGVVRAVLSTTGDNAGLALSDKAGNPRALLGNTQLTLERTGSTEHRPVSSLVLLRENGKVLWEAP